MGNTCSWFGPLRCSASAATQFACFLVDDADRHVEEVHLPVSILGFLDGNSFAYESAANVDEVASPFDLAVGADLAHRRFGPALEVALAWHEAKAGRRLQGGVGRATRAAALHCSRAQMSQNDGPARHGLAAVAAWLPEV